uniref:Glutathione peroxidase n=1 Tax=Gasterosteus aculeatus aculeatus TaxID=481459 RepID=G3NCW5_GASAC
MACKSIYDFSVETLDGQLVPLSNYRGKVLLIINVYHRLNALTEMFGDLNFTVLAFPSNQFGLQSPEVNHETLNILKYVRPGCGFVPKFPVFGRVEVNGVNEDPLFTYLKELLPFVNPVIGDMKKFYWNPISVNDIRWNFEKFLIAADGMPFKRYEPHCPIENVEKDIADLL